MDNLSHLLHSIIRLVAQPQFTPDASLVSHWVNIFLFGKGKRVAGNQNNTRWADECCDHIICNTCRADICESLFVAVMHMLIVIMMVCVQNHLWTLRLIRCKSRDKSTEIIWSHYMVYGEMKTHTHTLTALENVVCNRRWLPELCVSTQFLGFGERLARPNAMERDARAPKCACVSLRTLSLVMAQLHLIRVCLMLLPLHSLQPKPHLRNETIPEKTICVESMLLPLFISEYHSRNRHSTVERTTHERDLILPSIFDFGPNLKKLFGRCICARRLDKFEILSLR